MRSRKRLFAHTFTVTIRTSLSLLDNCIYLTRLFIQNTYLLQKRSAAAPVIFPRKLRLQRLPLLIVVFIFIFVPGLAQNRLL